MNKLLKKVEREMNKKLPVRLKKLEKEKVRLSKMLDAIPESKETSTDRLWIEIKFYRIKRAIIALKAESNR